MSIEIKKNNFKVFTYTVKALGKDLDPDYKKVFDKLNQHNVDIHYIQGERDDKGKFHYHGLINLPNGFFRKKLIVQGFNMKLEEFYPGDEWKKYAYKDVPNESKPEDIKVRPMRNLFKIKL